MVSTSFRLPEDMDDAVGIEVSQFDIDVDKFLAILSQELVRIVSPYISITISQLKFQMLPKRCGDKV